MNQGFRKKTKEEIEREENIYLENERIGKKTIEEYKSIDKSKFQLQRKDLRKFVILYLAFELQDESPLQGWIARVLIDVDEIISMVEYWPQFNKNSMPYTVINLKHKICLDDTNPKIEGDEDDKDEGFYTSRIIAIGSLSENYEKLFHNGNQ